MRLEPVFCPVSPLFITSLLYTVQASTASCKLLSQVHSSGRDLKEQLSARSPGIMCHSFLHLFHFLFLVQGCLKSCYRQRGHHVQPAEDVLASHLLGKLTDQLPHEFLFINKALPMPSRSSKVPPKFACFIVKSVKNTFANHFQHLLHSFPELHCTWKYVSYRL